MIGGITLPCQVCSSPHTREFLDLGHHPPPLVLPTEEGLRTPEKRYPLRLLQCQSCGLVQIGYTVDPKELFLKYTYESSASVGFPRHLHQLSEHVIQRFGISSRDLILDIGSNDGTSLEQYAKHGIRVLGVEPSNIGELAVARDVPTIRDFFDQGVAEQIAKTQGQAKVITALNVFAHVARLDSFIKGVDLLLEESGVFLTESHYLLDLVSKLEYDAIYHEHLRYYSLKSLIALLERYGFTVFDAVRIPTHGGSIRVYACRPGKYPVSESVQSLVDQENRARLESFETLADFARRVHENRLRLKCLLWELKCRGNKIVGISAPARSSTILNYCLIGPDVLDYVAETSKIKIGRYSPGMHIPIVDESRLYTDQPEYAMLLSWHLKDDIVPRIREKGYRGKFIMPLPHVEIV